MRDSRHETLGEGAEFDAIRTVLGRLGHRATGAGDDAALVDVPSGSRLAASVDVTVQGVHFRSEWIAPAEVGYRAVTAALSDLAAMGAAPLGVLAAFVVPGPWRERLSAVVDGIGAAVERAGTKVIGGNLSRGTEFSLTTTVLGHVRHELRRDAIRTGHLLYVTGRLGAPGAAVAAWLEGRIPLPEHRRRFAAPVARLAEGQWLAAAGAAAAIDISDGLLADAGHLAAAGGVGIVLEAHAIPLVNAVTPHDALASGEEYELLVSAAEPLDTAAFEAAFGIPLTRIGWAVASHPGTVVVQGDDGRVAGARGHDHFQR